MQVIEVSLTRAGGQGPFTGQQVTFSERIVGQSLNQAFIARGV